MKRLLLIMFSLSFVFLVGCKDEINNTPSVLKPASLLVDPIIRQYSDSDVHISKFSTFTVLPKNIAVDPSISSAFGNELLEKQMLFALRNQLEYLGYKFEAEPSKADFIVTIDGSNEYKTTYIPPSTITLPDYVPSKIVNSTINESGSVSLHGPHGSVYGTYSGTSYQSTTTPGYWTTRTYHTPSRTVGNYYPSITITAYDCKTGKSVWYGTSIGCSDNPDIRVSSQLLVKQLLDKMSPSEMSRFNYPFGLGLVGLDYVPFTPNGDNIYPLVISALKGSQASKAGLRYGDIIVSINGQETVNKTFSEVVMMMPVDIDSDCAFGIYRENKIIEIKLKRTTP